jgi:hypothetical protein
LRKSLLKAVQTRSAIRRAVGVIGVTGAIVTRSGSSRGAALILGRSGLLVGCRGGLGPILAGDGLLKGGIICARRASTGTGTRVLSRPWSTTTWLRLIGRSAALSCVWVPLVSCWRSQLCSSEPRLTLRPILRRVIPRL